MKSSQIKVSELGEKQLIERIIQKSKSCSIYKPSDFNDFDDKTSIGDDSALTNVNIDDNSYLVSSSDMLIQSSHFPKAMTHFQMGYKSVVVNVSDLASMGAENIGFLLNLAIPKDTLLDDFDELVCGVIQACDNYNIPLIGGDTNEASEIIISGTAIGQVDKERALMKYGFEIGDLLCISGELAYAALGFELLKLIEENPKSKEIIEKIKSIDSTLIDLAILKALKPEAKYKEGHILRDYNTIYEIISSDKKYHNGEDSYTKGIRIYEEKLPVEDEFKEIANVLGLNYLDLFFHVGEDFELLFTINKELKDQLSSDMNYYVIGEITDNNTVEIVLSNGNIEKISSRGYQHLK